MCYYIVKHSITKKVIRASTKLGVDDLCRNKRVVFSELDSLVSKDAEG
jgi:hypothetical protein